MLSTGTVQETFPPVPNPIQAPENSFPIQCIKFKVTNIFTYVTPIPLSHGYGPFPLHVLEVSSCAAPCILDTALEYFFFYKSSSSIREDTNELVLWNLFSHRVSASRGAISRRSKESIFLLLSELHFLA